MPARQVELLELSADADITPSAAPTSAAAGSARSGDGRRFSTRNAVVKAPAAMKPAWPSEIWPARPVRRLSASAPMAASAVCVTRSSAKDDTNRGSTSRTTSSRPSATRRSRVSTSARSLAYVVSEVAAAEDLHALQPLLRPKELPTGARAASRASRGTARRRRAAGRRSGRTAPRPRRHEQRAGNHAGGLSSPPTRRPRMPSDPDARSEGSRRTLANREMPASVPARPASAHESEQLSWIPRCAAGQRFFSPAARM